MGLDSFWEHPEGEHLSLVFDPPLKLIGGMFSSHGAGSFRGKAYAEMLESITGYSIYTECMPNEDVCQMANKLEHWLEGHPKLFNKDWVTEHLPDIVRMFKAYAKAGFQLRGWW